MAKQKKEEEKVVLPTTTFDVDKVGTFKFRVPVFRIIGMNDNQPIKATDALKNHEILGHLVKVKSHVIEKVAEATEEEEAK
jgi:hypothetical protein